MNHPAQGGPSNNFDEVTLNLLLAEGVDVPTAWEASRRDGDCGSAVLGVIGGAIVAVVALLVIVALVLLLV